MAVKTLHYKGYKTPEGEIYALYTHTLGSLFSRRLLNIYLIKTSEDEFNDLYSYVLLSLEAALYLPRKCKVNEYPKHPYL